MNIGLAVLAGGGSRRMGRDKGIVDVAGRPMTGWVIDALEAGSADATVTDRAVVTGSPAYEGFGWRVIPDLHPGLGPLAGIETALTGLDADAIVIVACDMPLAAPRLIARLIAALEEAVAVIPDGPEGPEPCLAGYRVECLPVVSRLIAEGRLSASGLVDELAPVGPISRPGGELDEFELRGLANVNTPEDLERAAARLA